VPINKSEAKCVFMTKTEEDAATIVASLRPDNIIDPPMKIKMKAQGKKVIISIKDCKKIKTLLLTLDEIFEHMTLNQKISNLLDAEDIRASSD